MVEILGMKKIKCKSCIYFGKDKLCTNLNVQLISEMWSRIGHPEKTQYVGCWFYKRQWWKCWA